MHIFYGTALAVVPVVRLRLADIVRCLDTLGWPSLAILACGLTTACGNLDPYPALGEVRQTVVNGEPSVLYPAVGILTGVNPDAVRESDRLSFCTATLVGPAVVSTAAHCIKTEPNATHSFLVDGQTYQAAAVQQHPHFDRDSPIWPNLVNDIGLIFLVAAPPDSVPRIPLAVSEPVIGQAVTIIGFGMSGEQVNDVGVKRTGNTVIADVRPTYFELPPSATDGNLCDGDSGGPTLSNFGGFEAQVGVNSGKISNCGDGGIETRVDAYRDWIESTARAFGYDINVVEFDVAAASYNGQGNADFAGHTGNTVIGGCNVHASQGSESRNLWAAIALILLAFRRRPRRVRAR